MKAAIAIVPFIIALIAYIRSYVDLFEPLQVLEPASWLWKANQPILTSTVSPLVLASNANASKDDLQLLLGVTLILIVAFLLIFGIMTRAVYFRMQVPVGFGSWEPSEKMTPARLMFTGGSSVIVLAAVSTLYVGESI
jgi:hypothetical protein